MDCHICASTALEGLRLFGSNRNRNSGTREQAGTDGILVRGPIAIIVTLMRTVLIHPGGELKWIKVSIRIVSEKLRTGRGSSRVPEKDGY